MKPWRVALGALLLGAAPTALTAVPGDAPNPIFTGADLFNLSVASDPQISPDGRTIAYVRLTADIMSDRMRPSIWLIDVASGAQTPIAAGTGADYRPAQQPEQHRLVARWTPHRLCHGGAR